MEVNRSMIFGIIILLVGVSGLGLGIYSVVNFSAIKEPEDQESIYAQLEGSAQTFSANSWTGITFNNMTVGQGISFLSQEINFTQSGTYRITVTFRVNSGLDVWTAIRLYGDGSSRGHSVGFGTELVELITVSFFAVVVKISTSYQIQIGRLNSDLGISDPLSITGESLPAIQATIEKID